MTEPKLTRIEKLRIAGEIAPKIRDAAHGSKKRRIKVTDKTGKIVREIDSLELHKKIRERMGIEFDVVEGPGDKHECIVCGSKFVRRGLRAVCPKCRSQKRCAGWEGTCRSGWPAPPRKAFDSGFVRKRHGGPWRCQRCAARKRSSDLTPEDHKRLSETAKRRSASLTPEQRKRFAEQARDLNRSVTPEQRSERARKMHAARTPERRSEIVRKANAALTPEQRSERARKTHAARTPERRSEIARKANASLTYEQRSKIRRKANAALTPEQRSEIARKRAAAMTPERRSEMARKANAALTYEQRSMARRKAWRTRRRSQRGSS